jgi:hypothetical protein
VHRVEHRAREDPLEGVADAHGVHEATAANPRGRGAQHAALGGQQRRDDGAISF